MIYIYIYCILIIRLQLNLKKAFQGNILFCVQK